MNRSSVATNKPSTRNSHSCNGICATYLRKLRRDHPTIRPLILKLTLMSGCGTFPRYRHQGR